MAHQGFDAVAKKVGSPALAAWIGRKKYGKKKFQQAANEGKPLKESQKLPKFKGKKKAAPPPYRGK
jgi:hypothetical protein